MTRGARIAVLAAVVVVAMYVGAIVSARQYVGTAAFRAWLDEQTAPVALTFAKVRMGWDGCLVVDGLSVQETDPAYTWRVTAEEARACIGVRPLARREVSIERLRAKGVVLSLTQAHATDAAAKESAPTATQAPDESDDEPWSLAFRGLEIEDLREGTFNEWVVRGRARLSGDVLVTEDDELALSDARLEIAEGALARGDQRFGSTRDTSVEVSLAPASPGEPAADLVGKIGARLEAAFAIEPGVLTTGLDQPWLRVRDGGGTLAVKAVVEKGAFAPDSHAQVTYEDLSARVFGLDVKGAGELAIDVASDGVATKLAFTRYTAGESFEGSELVLTLAAPAREVTGLTTPASWIGSLRLAPAELKDARLLNALIPRSTGLRVEAGKGRIEASASGLSLASSSGVARLLVKAEGARARLDDVTIAGRFDVEVDAKAIDLGAAAAQLAARIVLDDVATTRRGGEEADKGWHARFETAGRLTVPDAGPGYAGKVSMSARNIKPVLIALDVWDGLPDFVAARARLSDVEVRAVLAADDEQLRLTDAELTAKGVTAKAWYDGGTARRAGAALVEVDPLTVGLRLDGSEIETKLVNAATWYAASAASHAKRVKNDKHR